MNLAEGRGRWYQKKYDVEEMNLTLPSVQHHLQTKENANMTMMWDLYVLVSVKNLLLIKMKY